jgi:hypothetical protein
MPANHRDTSRGIRVLANIMSDLISGRLPAVGLSTLPLNSQDIGTSRWQLGQIYVGTLA